ncbi:vWA-like protein, partial [Yasminevirus sp. GU-2018]
VSEQLSPSSLTLTILIITMKCVTLCEKLKVHIRRGVNLTVIYQTITMNIRTKILLFLVVPFIVAYVAISAITLSILIPSFKDASTQISDYVLESELSNLKIRNRNIAELTGLNFGRIIDDAELLANYTESVINNKIPIVGYYKNFYAGDYVNSVDVPPEGLINGQNTYHSVWLNKYIRDESQLPYLNISSMADNVWRAIFDGTKKYTGFYIGFEDATFRRFPYMDVSRYLTTQYVCAIDQSTITGYDPRCRDWYVVSKATQGESVFTDPYIDANTGKMILSAGHSIAINGSFVGVVGVSLSMTNINNMVVADEIYQNGYNFIVNIDGDLVVYPDLKRDRVYKVYDDLYEKSDFKKVFDKIVVNASLLNNTYAQESLQFNTTKSGKMWWVTYNSVPNTEYIIITLVPESDLIQSITEINSSVNDIIVAISVVIGVMFCVFALIQYFSSNFIAKKVTRPIEELNAFTKNVQKGDLSIEMGLIEQKSSDIVAINNSFMNLIKVVRYANKSYADENLHLAYKNYLEVKEMLTKLKNKRGLGAVLNNLGTTVWKLEDVEHRLDKAEEYFNLAIKNAEYLIETTKTEDAKVLFKIKLASRYMNLGQFYAEQPHPDPKRAEKAYKKSIKLNREVDNKLGEIITMGNLGLLLMKDGKLEEAHQLFTDAYDVISDRLFRNPVDKNAEIMQYASLNMAIYYRYTRQYDLAVRHINYSLSLRPTIKRMFKQKCLSELYEVYSEAGDMSAVERVRREMGVSKDKHILFVLDCSGSMEGPAIIACRASIVNILVHNLTGGDTASMITFNTTTSWLFTNKDVRDVNMMTNKVYHNTKPEGGTAFYDALMMASQHVVSGGMTSSDQWIVALTDGDDNKSSPNAKNKLISYIRENGVNVIIIAHGKIDTIEELKSITRASPKGILLKSDNTVGINEAFQKAIKLINKGYENIESI